MKDVDLTQFQFDYDLTWAAFFMNPDGAIYGRYGTRSVAGAMAHNSIESLKAAMKRALDLHDDYPANQASLAGKRGEEPRWKTALSIPALRRQFAKKLMQPTGKGNCIHCHNIHNGWIDTAYDEGNFDKQSIWIYPLPDNVGMPIDVDTGVVVERVIKDSFADKAGIEAGDVIGAMNGQPILSQADMQWVLHHLPNVATLEIQVERSGQAMTKTLSLSGDWKQSDISWRASTWSIRPKLKIWTPELSDAEKAELGLASGDLALRAKWINNPGAKEAGLKTGDIIVEADGKAEAMTPGQFNLWIKLTYQPGDKLPIKVLRENQKIALQIPLLQ
jgi:hypothetical protein